MKQTLSLDDIELIIMVGGQRRDIGAPIRRVVYSNACHCTWLDRALESYHVTTASFLALYKRKILAIAQ